MKPALSIIFFTVSSGAGLGLCALLALVDLFAPGALPERAIWRGMLLALLLVGAGLVSSVVHLANPANAWRAFSRFRTSWLSREAVFAVIFFVFAAGYALLVFNGTAGFGRKMLASLTCALAWTVIFCTAMIYASLKPIRQWHTRWTPLNYALLGHWSGALLLVGLALAYANDAKAFVRATLAIGIVALASKLGYWLAIADERAAATLERAIGVAQGVSPPGPISVAHARLLDVGHSHGTFLTHEFGFVLAREHARALRIAAVALGFALPLAWLLAGPLEVQAALAAAVLCIIGLLTERWLFFAEARHTVRLYHGDPRT